MPSFGGTPLCARCGKVVYAAEQTMGPGRKIYHKPCLTCTSCGKRLDSYSLLEHDEEPYCKNCHVKLFAMQDLRLANLPNRDEVFLSPSSPTTSPTRRIAVLPTRTGSPPLHMDRPPSLPPRRHGGSLDTPTSAMSSYSPRMRPARAWSPVRDGTNEGPNDEQREEEEVKEQLVVQNDDFGSTATHTGRSSTGFPRTVPLSPIRNRFSTISVSTSQSVFDAGAPEYPDVGSRMNVPLPTHTGTRYGAALSGASSIPVSPAATGRQWGGTPRCPKCGQAVYFAEQIKAIGKTYHKGCLRCTECNTLLDSTRLNERDGNPFCNRCYSKLYGPQGSGYALLGKAGA
ncbi:uncharacterized protein LAESUDRAFT_684152 [Laetiporus sulphureus 93-53]|uniref:LIM zinc-binding domain-containing protein n=1 Tax=Laetiporus sulphureus 93-53 TaxID=1314785 RepID=A0A165CRV9_9APHY|nr:uncharacterized protein LAESUDRAFT_684152 [Laetiporus sulphureus 93-53]KZT03325.1 hypothetical protein LAESUDRAFT_684152 [Laetiporus sulphureus 93-53]